jgi:hypothetical protein
VPVPAAYVSIYGMPPREWYKRGIRLLDPFASSCNMLFGILRHLPNSEGLTFESDLKVNYSAKHRASVICDFRRSIF